MSETISKYFTSKLGGSKRRPSSSSSDPLSSPTNSETANRGKKKTKTYSATNSDCDSAGDMEEIQSMLSCIKDKMNFVCTKEDLQCLRTEMKEEITKLSETLSHRLDTLESSVFDLAQEKDRLAEEVKSLRKENGELRDRLEVQETEDRRLRAAHNDLEQHGRLWNVRVYGVKEAANPKEETAQDCVRKCVDIFSRQVGVPVRPEDVEVAHRSGRQEAAGGRGGARPRPILVRFFSRQIKRNVLGNRKKLKQSGISISEDLTSLNYKLLKTAMDHSGSLSAWSTNGKILVKLKNGVVVPLNIQDNVNETIRKKMI